MPWLPSTLRGRLLLVFYGGVLLTLLGFSLVYSLLQQHQQLTSRSLELPEATELWLRLDQAVGDSQGLLQQSLEVPTRPPLEPPEVVWESEVRPILEHLQELYGKARVWEEERAAETRFFYDTRLLLRSLKDLQDEVAGLALESPEDALVLFRERLGPLEKEIRGSISGLIRIQLDLSRNNLAAVQQHLLELNQRVVWAALLMLLGLALLAGLLARQIVNPLKRLQHAILQLKEDRFQGDLGWQRRDEIGDLAREFQQMAEAIRERTRQLERSHEDLSRAYRDLDAATQARSEFFAGMSHDLRTPLNAIIGFADALLQETPEDPLTPYQADRLRRILNSGRQLLEMLNSLLDLSKIEAGRMPLHVEPFDLAICVRDAAQLLEPLWRQKQLSCEVHLEHEPWPCTSDEGKLRQILHNLMGNAIKFTPAGGTLKVDAAQEGDWVRLSVQDSGIGIPEAAQEQVFEMFQQVETHAAFRGQGTGLGLALVRRMVDLLEGTVTLKSQEGQGSTFTVRFPAQLGTRSPGP
jgi:signal transduction histidine kinase